MSSTPAKAKSQERRLVGLAVSSGVAMGPAFVLAKETFAVPRRTLTAEEVAPEQERLAKAVEAAKADLDSLSLKSQDLPKAAGEEIRLLLDAHKAMLSGSRLVRGAEARIARNKINAEAALDAEVAAITASFSALDDAYIAARSADVRAVGAKLMRLILHQSSRTLADIPKGAVVIAEEINPADAALLDPARIVGLATALGGAQGHAGIMARALGLPAAMAVPDLLREAHDAHMVIVDGRQGLVILDPLPRTLAEYEDVRSEIKERKKGLRRLKTLPAVTKDGTVIGLGANLELPLEVAAAVAAGAENVGLLRTEFMFMNRTTLPDEEQQYAMLRHVVEGMEGRPVTIRTIDVGGEKIAAALEHKFASSPNPSLGLRAIRLSLREPHLLEAQFAAILRAGAHGPVRIMLPMITTVGEVQQARRILEIVARKLKRRKVPMIDCLPPVGVLIEVPGAALIADELAKVSDFFAIGTNDLTQYTLAVDRGDEQVAELYDPLHPAVLKLIRLSVEAAQKANIPLSVCGEMAGDARFTALLLALGVRELSMAPTHIPLIKAHIREFDLNNLSA